MLKFRYIEMRNFLSFGNVAQRVELDRSPLSIILGMNYDATNTESDEETRNGVGKSSVIQALNFAIYGKSVGNKIKVGNLVNKINKRHCEVTLVFEKDGTEYKIIRRRGPTDLKFFIGEDDFDDLSKDEAQGENRDSQETITEIIGMSQELFQQIVTITTSVDSFLGLGNGKQRQLIEELLTITQLSEKAEKLKENLKDVKAAIEREQFRVDTIDSSNQKIHESIKSLEAQSTAWMMERDERIASIEENLQIFGQVDIEAETALQEEKKKVRECNERAQQVMAAYTATQERKNQWTTNYHNRLTQVREEIEHLSSVDINAELEAHQFNSVLAQLTAAVEKDTATKKYHEQQATFNEKQGNASLAEAQRLKAQLDNTHGAKCHTCGGDLEKDKHEQIVADLTVRIEAACSEAEKFMELVNAHTAEAAAIEIPEVPPRQVTVYGTESEALQHQSSLEALRSKEKEIQAEECPYDSELASFDLTQTDCGTEPETHYDSMEQVYQHISVVDSLTKELAQAKEQKDPYEAQIITLRNDSLQPVDYDELNRLRKMQEHQEFLIKLLTDKNSFVRKRIIDQNLSFLNQRLHTYMEKSGSLHTVLFMNDLSVDITKLGDTFDFDNLSRGEKNRVIIALTMAFRDMYESLNCGVNIMFIDELLDNGLDKAGCMSALRMLKDMSNQDNKNIYLITHREEIQEKADNIMTVVMENSFTTITQE